MPTAEHPATNGEVKRWGLIPAVVAGLSAVLGTGGVIAFLVGYAGTVEAKAVTAAQAIATVQAQRGDVLAAEQKAQKERLEHIDAGLKVEIRQVREEVQEMRKELREVLREVKKR